MHDPTNGPPTPLDPDRTAYLIADATEPDQPIVDVSGAFTEMTGYARAEVLGWNCRFLQGSDTDPVTVDRIRDAIAAERDITVILLNYRKDGTPFWNEVTIGPVRDSQDRVTHFLGVQTEVPEPDGSNSRPEHSAPRRA